MKRNGNMRVRHMAATALLGLTAVVADAQDGPQLSSTVIGTLEAFGLSAGGTPRVQIRGREYPLGAPRIDYGGGVATDTRALLLGTRVRLHLRRVGAADIVERIEILPD